MTEQVRVRFAPSPTGNVHIGNIRVCIYNWLFARHSGGKMLLRVEDTDRERSTPEAIRTLLEALAWLGLDYDEAPVYQSACLDRHRAAAQQLLDSGHAYYSDKGDASRGQALLFRMTEDAVYKDLILGERSKAVKDMADFVIMKSDNTPVFHLANVVDDIDMGITHILRGNDHVENTFRHVMLFKALGHKPPQYAHFPMIVNAQGKPYSKRDGDAYVGDFRAKGYFADALFNFLALCGWSPGDDREVMTREEMIKLFTIDRVGSSASQFDLKKMEWMNGEYLKRMPDTEFMAALQAAAGAAGLDMGRYDADRLAAMAALYRERLKTTAEFPAKAAFFFTDEFEYDKKSVDKFIRCAGGPELLAELHRILEAAPVLDEAALKAPFEELMAARGLGFLKLAQPIRIALTGGTVSPGIFETLAIMDRDDVLRRMRRAIERFGTA